MADESLLKWSRGKMVKHITQVPCMAILLSLMATTSNATALMPISDAAFDANLVEIRNIVVAQRKKAMPAFSWDIDKIKCGVSWIYVNQNEKDRIGRFWDTPQGQKSYEEIFEKDRDNIDYQAVVQNFYHELPFSKPQEPIQYSVGSEELKTAAAEFTYRGSFKVTFRVDRQILNNRSGEPPDVNFYLKATLWAKDQQGTWHTIRSDDDGVSTVRDEFRLTTKVRLSPNEMQAWIYNPKFLDAVRAKIDLPLGYIAPSHISTLSPAEIDEFISAGMIEDKTLRNVSIDCLPSLKTP